MRNETQKTSRAISFKAMLAACGSFERETCHTKDTPSFGLKNGGAVFLLTISRNWIPIAVCVNLSGFYCFHPRFVAGFGRMPVNVFATVPAFFAGTKTDCRNNGKRENDFFHGLKF